MISIQTNYASMVGANNLNVNNNFQTSTIEALTSGYRINSSGDDPAGLAVANQYSSDVAQLTQGIINANSGVSTLQIVDGGMSNISTMLDRMQTLATESASGTFAGNRATVNAEFQTLQTEIDREANNIGLGTSNSSNAGTLSVFIGGGSSLANSQVAITNLTKVDANTLGVGTGVDVLGAMQATTNFGNLAMTGSGALLVNTSQSFAFTSMGSTGNQTVTATVAGGSAGITGQQALTSLNAQLNPYGVQATTDASGYLEFQNVYDNAFTVTAGAATNAGEGLASNLLEGLSAPTGTSGTADALAAVTAINSAISQLGTAQGAVGAGENDLNYAIGLATSQSTNYSSAESQIRDADVATEASNLTKAQVLQQASVAAMAQANAAPQALLKLLQ
ncbi:MAG: flagellin [Bryobacteraceae bacterium]|jgi:flagellin